MASIQSHMCWDKNCKISYCGKKDILISPQGGYKTSSAVYNALYYISRKQHVWINEPSVICPDDIYLKGPHAGERVYDPIYLHHYDIIEDIFDVTDAHIFHDESASEADSRGFMSLNPDIRKWIREIKKRHVHLEQLTQVFKDLDVTFSRQADHVYQYRIFPFRIVWKEQWSRGTRDINIDPLWQPVSGFDKVIALLDTDNWFRVPSWVFKYYDRTTLYISRPKYTKEQKAKIVDEKIRRLSTATLHHTMLKLK